MSSYEATSRPGLPAVAKPKLDALTGCRFFAASLVVWYHYFPRAFNVSAWLHGPITHGYMAVSFFFVLSGFVLTYNYSTARFDARERKRFWTARFCRIYPTYLVALILAAPLHLFIRRDGGLHFSLTQWLLGGLLSLFCLQAFFPQTAFSWNSPGWSLSCEAFFYALFPKLVTTLRRQTDRHLLIFSAFVWGLGIFPPAAFVAARGVGWQSGSHGWETPTSLEEVFTLTFPLFHLPAFITGMVAALLYIRRGPLKLRHSLSIAPLACALIVATCCSSIAREFLWDGILAPAFAALIYALTTARVSNALKTLGDASYALYILQYPAVMALSANLQQYGITESRQPLLRFVLLFCGLCAASVVVARVANRTRIRRLPATERLVDRLPWRVAPAQTPPATPRQ